MRQSNYIWKWSVLKHVERCKDNWYRDFCAILFIEWQKERRKSSNCRMWMKRIRSRKKRSKEERESTKDGKSLHPARSYSWLTQLFHDSFVVRRQSRLRFMLTRLNYFGEGSIDNKQRSRFREYSRFYSLGKKERKKEEEQDGLKTFIFFRSYFPTHICRPLQEWKIHMSSCSPAHWPAEIFSLNHEYTILVKRIRDWDCRDCIFEKTFFWNFQMTQLRIVNDMYHW